MRDGSDVGGDEGKVAKREEPRTATPGSGDMRGAGAGAAVELRSPRSQKRADGSIPALSQNDNNIIM